MEVFSGDNFQPGTKAFGIPWRSDLMDLWMSFSNKSGSDYMDFSVSIEGIAMEDAPKDVSIGFYEIAQVDGLTEFRTQLSGTIRAAVGGFTRFQPPLRPIDGMNLENTAAAVRADCLRFANGSSAKFIIALTNVRSAPGPKFKPAAAGVEFHYTVNGEAFTKKILVDIRDMDKIDGKPKRTVEELELLRSRLVRGTATGVTDTFSTP